MGSVTDQIWSRPEPPPLWKHCLKLKRGWQRFDGWKKRRRFLSRNQGRHKRDPSEHATSATAIANTSRIQVKICEESSLVSPNDYDILP
jgi:hypothetical protein